MMVKVLSKSEMVEFLAGKGIHIEEKQYYPKREFRGVVEFYESETKIDFYVQLTDWKGEAVDDRLVILKKPADPNYLNKPIKDYPKKDGTGFDIKYQYDSKDLVVVYDEFEKEASTPSKKKIEKSINEEATTLLNTPFNHIVCVLYLKPETGIVWIDEMIKDELKKKKK